MWPWVPDISLTHGTSPRAGAKFRHDSEHVRTETALVRRSAQLGYGLPREQLQRAQRLREAHVAEGEAANEVIDARLADQPRQRVAHGRRRTGDCEPHILRLVE